MERITYIVEGRMDTCKISTIKYIKPVVHLTIKTGMPAIHEYVPSNEITFNDGSIILTDPHSLIHFYAQ